MSHLLILGAQGQVGRALAARANAGGIPYRALSRAECDITRPLAVERALEGARVAVNCAAYTAVDRAESDRDAAHAVNAIGPENIAAACAKLGIPMFHLSTDYVFDGEQRRPWVEDDPPDPLSVYGRSKLGGERAIRARLEQHIILRTSWVFSADGENFVKTMLRLSRNPSELRIIDDQVGGPTAADDIAAAIINIAADVTKPGFSAWGTYHFSGAPAVSWYGFAQAILEGRGTAIVPIATKDYPRPARRPMNSVLDCGRILRIFGIGQPDWRLALAKVLGELAART
jgi:dTDP-4-dehydrorhamnose reductase